MSWAGQVPMTTPAKLGPDRFRALLRQGQDRMPAFTATVLPADDVNALETYLASLPVADDPNGAEAFLRLPQNPNRYSGPQTRYAGSFSGRLESWGTGADPVWKNPFHRKEGKIGAQGYHVFALP